MIKKLRSYFENKAFEELSRNYTAIFFKVIKAVNEKQDTATIAMNNCHKDIFLGITIILAANYLYSIQEKP